MAIGNLSIDGPLTIDGTRFTLASPMQMQNLTTFPGKVSIGAYDVDSDPRLSLWAQRDFSGGHGIEEIIEGVDQNRCRWSTLYTRFPSQTSVPFTVTQYTAASDTNGARLLGDLYESGAYRAYATYGAKLVRWDETGLAFSSTLDTLAGTPVNKAVEFKGTGTRKLFIPTGANGYSTWDGSAKADVATPLAKAFCLWDDKLICLDTDGQLHYSTDGTAWTSYATLTTMAKLDVSYTPRNLITYFDQASNPAVFVIHDQGAHAFDPNGPKLYQVEGMEWPPHPYQALGSAKWRNHLYVTIGMGVRRYTGEIVQPMGLDRDNGLPAQYRGRILDLEPASNDLFALVIGGESGSTSYPHLQTWTDYGWHTLWADTTARTTSKVTWARTSRAQGVYRVWWGDGTGNLKTMALPVDDASPRAKITAGTGNFAGASKTNDATGTQFLETGRFDAGMAGYDKVANNLYVKVKGVTDGSATNAISVFYRVDGATAWTFLGQQNFLESGAVGVNFANFGTQLTGCFDIGYSGLIFNDIEFRFELGSVGGTTAPYIEYFAFYYIKVQPPGKQWTATLDLTKCLDDESPRRLADKLDDLIESGLFYTMYYRVQDSVNSECYRVRLVSVDGPEATGGDERSTRTIALLEVPPGAHQFF